MICAAVSCGKKQSGNTAGRQLTGREESGRKRKCHFEGIPQILPAFFDFTGAVVVADKRLHPLRDTTHGTQNQCIQIRNDRITDKRVLSDYRQDHMIIQKNDDSSGELRQRCRASKSCNIRIYMQVQPERNKPQAFREEAEINRKDKRGSHLRKPRRERRSKDAHRKPHDKQIIQKHICQPARKYADC